MLETRGLFSILFLSAMALPAVADEKKPITFDQIQGRDGQYSLAGRATGQWSKDGRSIEFRKDGKAMLMDPSSGDVREDPGRDEAEKAREARLAKAMEARPEFSAQEAKAIASRAIFTGDSCLLSQAHDLYFYRDGDERARRLTYSRSEERLAQLSEDHRFVSFVREHNLFVMDTEGGRARAISEDGSENLLYGELDWVYQEEVYGRGTWTANWWSPDSKSLAFLRIEEEGVPSFSIVNHIPFRQERLDMRYPKAGDPNPRASLGVVRAAGGDPVWMDLSTYAANGEFLIVSVGWSPDASKVIFQVQNRLQTWLDVVEGDPQTGKIRRLLHEESENAWVNVLGEPRWLKDGSFLWQSERTGYRHIYRYDKNGKLLAPLTTGHWECKSIAHVDEKAEVVYFHSNIGDATGAQLCRVGFDGNGFHQITKEAGTHRASFNPQGTLYIDSHSSHESPPVTTLCKAVTGNVVREIDRAKIKSLDEHVFRVPEVFQIPTRDGYMMDATLLVPDGLDEGWKYPLWVPTYSGPDAPSVRNRWNARGAWNQFLAQEQFAVLQVNVRTASNRGKKYIDHCYKQLGVQELRDLEDAVRWMIEEYRWIDASRVGITGGSYGGFMSAYALTHSKLFSLGIALYGVYDWRDYDTIYTERYMSTPQLNPEGYSKTSCLEAAANLHGHLLIVHGTADDNVHFQNAIQFAYRLQEAEKSFEFMPYPRAGHGVRDRAQRRHLRDLEWKTMKEHLVAPQTGAVGAR